MMWNDPKRCSVMRSDAKWREVILHEMMRLALFVFHSTYAVLDKRVSERPLAALARQDGTRHLFQVLVEPPLQSLDALAVLVPVTAVARSAGPWLLLGPKPSPGPRDARAPADTTRIPRRYKHR